MVRPMTFRCTVALLVGLLALGSGCGGKAPPTPPACDLACADAIALRSVRETMRFAYNFALQGKEAGTQDATVPCIPTGHLRIVGDGSSNADLGTTTVNLTYMFSECKTFSKN